MAGLAESAERFNSLGGVMHKKPTGRDLLITEEKTRSVSAKETASSAAMAAHAPPRGWSCCGCGHRTRCRLPWAVHRVPQGIGAFFFNRLCALRHQGRGILCSRGGCCGGCCRRTAVAAPGVFAATHGAEACSIHLEWDVCGKRTEMQPY